MLLRPRVLGLAEHSRWGKTRPYPRPLDPDLSIPPRQSVPPALTLNLTRPGPVTYFPFFSVMDGREHMFPESKLWIRTSHLPSRHYSCYSGFQDLSLLTSEMGTYVLLFQGLVHI